MNQAVIRLESFSTDQNSKAQFSQKAVREAYDEGYENGRLSEGQSDLKCLASQLKQLANSLENEEIRRTQIRDEAVRSLMPLLSEVLDTLGRRPQSDRLQSRLTEELARLAQMSTPLQCCIRCHRDLRKAVERCVEMAGLNGIDIQETTSHGVSVFLNGGRIDFDKNKVTNEIRHLIAEVMESDE